MNCSTPGLPVHHQLPEFTQTHVHRVGDAISSSVIPFSSCLQSYPASGSFLMSQLFTSSGQSIVASASVLPMNIQGWFPLGLTGLISLQSRDSQESSPAPQLETINSWALGLLYGPTLRSVHNYGKNHSFAYTDLCCKVMSLLFNMLSRFVITFLVAWPLANFLVKFIFSLTFIGLGLHCLIPWS